MNGFDYAIAEKTIFPELINEYISFVSYVNEQSTKVSVDFNSAAMEIKTILNKINILENDVFDYIKNNEGKDSIIGNARILSIPPSCKNMQQALSSFKVVVEDDYYIYKKLFEKSQGGKYSLFDYNNDDRKRNSDLNKFIEDYEIFENSK